MRVQYTCAVQDSSGYAEAARNNIAALLTQPDIQLSIKPVSFENWRTDLGPEFQALQPFINKKLESEVNIIHLTPENFPHYRIPGIKNIGMTVWETTKLPTDWIDLCNEMDEIWVPCDWNVEVFKNSGVTVPVHKVPHTLNLDSISNRTSFTIDAISKDNYNFYSIFQWSSRKNPDGLIAAYLSEFNSDEKVCLVLKTYLNNSSSTDKKLTVELINAVKKDLQLQNTETAPIVLLHGSFSKDTMMAIHNSCDCFVLPHRAEGWGVPHFEAMAVGKPVITTGFSGNLEFMNGNTSYLTDFFMTPVRGMHRPNYTGKMDWAEPSISNLRYLMRRVFNNRDEAHNKALVGQEFIKKFDWLVVGKQMMELLNAKT